MNLLVNSVFKMFSIIFLFFANNLKKLKHYILNFITQECLDRFVLFVSQTQSLQKRIN